MSHDERDHIATDKQPHDDRSIDAIDGQLHQNAQTMSHDERRHIATDKQRHEDRSIDAIDGQLRQNGRASRTSLASEHLMTSSDPVHAVIASSLSVDRNGIDLHDQTPHGSTPTPPDTCHPSGEAPAALPCSVGGNLGRSSC